MANIIKQIKTPDNVVYDIHSINADNADKLGGKSLTDIEKLVNGAISTYVIKTTASTSNKTIYDNVVGSSAVQVSTYVSSLNTLTSSDTNNEYRLGDVILMGATSDGTKNFDRWVSNISGTGVSAIVTLDILETKTATHYHTFTPVITGSSKALTGVSKYNTTSVAKVGTSIDVVTDTDREYLTSVSYSTDDSNKGSYEIDLTTTTSSDADGRPHSHTVNSHSHTITFKPHTTLVSRTANAYTTLSTSSFTPHSHDSSTVAGAIDSKSDTITYITGGTTSAKFVTSISDSTANSNTGGSGELTTEKNSTTVGSDIKTLDGGSHSHDVTLTSEDDVVVTAASVAPSVVVSVSYNFTKPSVAQTVVTGVTYASKNVIGSASLTGTKTFFNNCSVDANGVLSFSSATVGISTTPVTVASITSVPTATQTQGDLTISAPRTSQSRSLGSVTVSGSTEDGGSHNHGFSHTHKISSHTHTYKKQVVASSLNLYTDLSVSSHSIHKHKSDVTVATVATDSDVITYVYSGISTSVVRDLKDSALSGVSTGSTSTNTENVYLKPDISIQFPGLKCTSTKLSKTSITPATSGGEVVTSVVFTDNTFVTNISGGNTTTNNPGSPS